VIEVVDLTARNKVAAALRGSEDRFRALLESIPQLVWTCTPAGECDYLSRQWTNYTGCLAIITFRRKIRPFRRGQVHCRG